MDITQNGAESGASLVELEIRETSEFLFIVRDNGKGMSEKVLDRAMDPFVTDGIKHPGRKVGLGLPFLIQTAIQSGGGWRIDSTAAGSGRAVRFGGDAGGNITGNAASAGVNGGGKSSGADSATGTSVEARFDLKNVDTPPVGDIPGLFRTVLLFNGPREIVLKRYRNGVKGKADLDYTVTKSELAEALGDDFEDVSSLALLGKYLKSLEGDDE